MVGQLPAVSKLIFRTFAVHADNKPTAIEHETALHKRHLCVQEQWVATAIPRP